MAGAVFVSVDDFTREGFTNGLFLQVRELLRRISARGHPVSIACVAQGQDLEVAHTTRQARGITVRETFIPVDNRAGAVDAYRQAVRDLLEDLDPEVIFLNSCAVFLGEAHQAVLEQCLARSCRVVVLVTDQLFPTSRTHPPGPVRRYYDLMRQASVHAVSQTIADALRTQTGVAAQVLPNLLPERPGARTAPGARGRCLTFINHHPIKGREVWDALVRQRPSDAYLVVETWPDVPSYGPPAPTVEVAAFAPDPVDIYRRTRVLLVPSLGPEGLPRVALEAMELEIPVVAHRIGSLPELGDAVMFVTPPAITGYQLRGTVLHPVVSPSDIQRAARDFGRVIDAIDHDPMLRARLAANGRARVRDYRHRSEAIVNRLLDAWFDGSARRPRGERGP